MSSSQSAAAGDKRKKPPTFQHLPEHRAKTLKKAWVEKTKIKSQWKALKRKEDLASASKLEIPVYDDEPRHDAASSGKAPYIHPSRAHIHPDQPVDQSKPEAAPSASKQPQNVEAADTDRPMKKRKRSEPELPEANIDPAQSLRELKREAYSSSTLHTFKADPLKKHRTSVQPGRGGRGGRGASAFNSGARGRGRGGGGEQGTGRGQPNMKLRMNAMLAQIKQDFA